MSLEFELTFKTMKLAMKAKLFFWEPKMGEALAWIVF